jgi:hypothetical protein
MNPPHTSEWLLRLALPARDRETVSGDLIEEYRETALPALGAAGAARWYRRQAMGIVWRAVRPPLLAGLAVGFVFGGASIVDTAVEPLRPDSIGGDLVQLAVLSSAITLTVAALLRRGSRMSDAWRTGVLVSIATVLMGNAMNLVRVNVFLEVIQYRDDWQGLMVQYHASGSDSLRAFANYTFLRGTPFVLVLASILGTISGAAARVVSWLFGATPRTSS